MSRINNAVNKFLDGYACSQAILSEYCDLFDLNHETALKLAAGFAGGMRMGGTCGAVTGAYMVLGLKFSDQNCEKAEGSKNVYKAVSEFTEKFEEINGSVNCKDLLDCDISTSEGMQVAKEKQLFQTVCPNFIKTSADILETMFEKR
jgi:C_GCAxxG_C_C family probable redox protein